MATIIGLTDVKAKLGNFSFNEFNIVRDFHFFMDLCEGNPVTRLDLIVESTKYGENMCLKLKLYGVCNLSISGFGSTLTQLGSLSINDITDKQWEKISWELDDYEEDRINCYAQKAEIAIVSMPKIEYTNDG